MRNRISTDLRKIKAQFQHKTVSKEVLYIGRPVLDNSPGSACRTEKKGRTLFAYSFVDSHGQSGGVEVLVHWEGEKAPTWVDLEDVIFLDENL